MLKTSFSPPLPEFSPARYLTYLSPPYVVSGEGRGRGQPGEVPPFSPRGEVKVGNTTRSVTP